MKRFLSVLISVVAFVFFTSGYVCAKQPIVFVHGFSFGLPIGSIWTPYKGWFQADGWPSSWLLSYSYDTNASVASGANVLKTKVDALLASTGQSKVDIIGWSMGGLVARYYMKNLGGAAKVRQLVTLGTPHRGTNVAWLWFTKSCVDMRPGSALINSLGTSQCKISLWSNCDEIIQPNSSAQCGTSVAVGCLGHITLTLNKGVYTKAKAYLL